MIALFYLAGAIAVVATVLMLTRSSAIHALLYLVVSLLAVAVVFFSLGAFLVAALQIIVYAGAIAALFLLVVMLFSFGSHALDAEHRLIGPRVWLWPSILSAVLLGITLVVLRNAKVTSLVRSVSPKQLALVLFGQYYLAVELASLLLLAALVGAYHLGAQENE